MKLLTDLSRFPIKKNNQYCKAFELTMPKPEMLNVLDMFRMVPQLTNMRNPYILIPRDGEDAIRYENSKEPIGSYSILLETSLLPLNPALNNGELNKKAAHVILNEHNEVDDVRQITTEHLKLYISNELSSIPICDKRYLITKLRKGERIAFKGDIRHAPCSKAQGSVICTPFYDYDLESMKAWVQYESRGYWTVDQIIEEVFRYIFERYQRYRALILDDTKEHQKQYHYESHTIIDKNFLHKDYMIENENPDDFDLPIKNALSNHINSTPGLMMTFDYMNKYMSIMVERKEDMIKLKNIFDEHLAYLNSIYNLRL